MSRKVWAKRPQDQSQVKFSHLPIAVRSPSSLMIGPVRLFAARSSFPMLYGGERQTQEDVKMTARIDPTAHTHTYSLTRK